MVAPLYLCRANRPGPPGLIAGFRIAYMEHAPHDFGGHKAEAIRSAQTAIRDLNEALRYRAKEDRK